MLTENFPKSVRYVKNGEGGKWWSAAKRDAQIHAGWTTVPRNLLQSADIARIRELDPRLFGRTQGAATSDRNALFALLDRPSQHLWVTFQDGDMWWCTVQDTIQVNPDEQSGERGNFWLTCATPWTNRSLNGRALAMSDLPGTVTSTAGFRATVCTPRSWEQILRAVRDEMDPDCVAASQARQAYEASLQQLVRRLSPKDFEVLIDLILSRDGWARIATLGGTREGIDLEVENAAAGEIAFVQVKSRADQGVLSDYVTRFAARRERYARMIFAVHTVDGALVSPPESPVQIWSGPRIAELVVRSGLGDWLAKRIG